MMRDEGQPEIRTCIRLLDGPESGGVIMGYPGEPPDTIAVFRTQTVAVGTLVCCVVDDRGLLGDLIYRKVSRSTLFDRPDWKGHPNVRAGCSYTFVHEVTETEGEAA